MPPHAAETSMLVDQQDDSSSSAHPKNVTFAINYELSSVDEFVESPHRQRRVILNPGTPVESIPESTAEDNDPPNLIIHCTNNNNNNNTPSNSNNTNNDATNTTATASSSSKGGQSSSFNSENSAPNSSDEDNNEVNSSRSNTGLTPTSTLTTQSADKTRRSARGQQGKRRDATLARTRVRYDMQIVPPVLRNQAFLDIFPLWWMPSTTTRNVPPPQRTQPRRKLPSSSSSSFLSSSLPEYPACNTCVPLPSPLPPPFLQDTSVIWIPSKRTEWEDSVSEMTAVCTSAALHRHVAAAASASDSTTGSSSKPIFHPPLSRDYIRDRVDIDDPLLGYQIRHKTGGWLQGFCLWTNFTTWTHYFKWDSLHEQSGMAAVVNDSPKVDRDGSLAQQLEALPREGDPMGGGIVFSAIAEIGLVGALGCGEYLLRMALDGIREKKQYKFVVLQATDSSKAFYEKFGFVRVGAICRYYVGINNASGGGDEEQQPIVGYRHWTHANESDASLQMHGGPSYMMCLKLPPIDGGDDDSPDVVCARCQQRPASARTQPSLLQAMLTLEVDEKPTIEQLGATSTPSLCRTIQRRNSKASSFAATTTDQQAALSNMVKKKARAVVPQPAAPPQQRTASAAPGKRKASPKGPARTVVDPTLPPPPLTTGARMKRSLSSRSSSSCPELRRPAKKHKPSGTVETIPREVLLSPPPEGKSLTYAQKQYQSVWLAVPPDDVKAVSKNRSRPPPKPRLPDTTTAALMPRDTAERTATTATNTMEVARQTLTTVAVASLDAAEQVAVTTLAIDASAVKASVVQSEPGVAPSAVAKEETADEPPARDVPRRAAAAVAAAAVAASSASAPKKVEKAGIGSKKSDKTDRVPTPPTRELPKRAAGMQKPSAITTAKKSPARARSRSKKSAMPKDEERLYYSVRGPDGRFVRVPIGSTITFTASVKASPKAVTHAITRSLPSHPTSQAATSLRTNKSTTSKISTSISVVNAKRAERSKPVPARIVEKVKHVDRSELRKQKVHSYPRTRPHFYNRVVKPADGSKTYLFVLNYNEDSEQLRLIPMEAKNTLTGQREGRPRYQCVVGDTDANFVTVSAHDYQVVAATMVMKTPFLAYEAWDIEDD
jgi:Beta-galactosidase C-terminal domain